jgi:hypothetical protein
VDSIPFGVDVPADLERARALLAEQRLNGLYARFFEPAATA